MRHFELSETKEEKECGHLFANNKSLIVNSDEIELQATI